jgi:phosphatidylinositol alpha-1,6-mannosyltransferase
MKILYLTAPGDPAAAGGIQRYARDVGNAMAGRGHEVRWLHCRPAEILASLRWQDRLPRPRYWNRFYTLRHTPVQDYRVHQAAEHRVRAVCREFGPDLVHTFFVHNLGALAARPVPVSVSCHGIEIQPLPPVFTMLRGATAIHANSAFTAALARRIAGDTISPTVLSWGVPAVPTRSVDKTYDLMTVSRLVKRKNVETVLRALASLPPLRYIVVGNGPERAGLQELACSLGLEHVEFAGEVSDDSLQSIFARTRAFVMAPTTSPEDFEGLGLVYYEAFAHGVPVIASRGGGVPEAVGNAGILVDDPTNVAAMARAIADVLTRHRLAELQQRVAERQRTHSWERFIDAFETWHRHVAASHGRLDP